MPGDSTTKKFKELIKKSRRILVTTHISPDPDAVSSLLLLGSTLALSYPGKKVYMVMEEKLDGLDFLNEYKKIKSQPLAQAMEKLRPDLFIMVDSNKHDRVSRTEGQKITDYIKSNTVKTITIDHHEHQGKDTSDIYIDSGNPAACQEVYELCFEKLKLKKPDGFAEATMLGLYADTGGFAYQNPRYRQTLNLAIKLISAGANVEVIKNHLSQYSKEQIDVLGELMTNLCYEHDYTYSFLSDKFVKEWTAANKPISDLQSARKKFVDEYIRNIENYRWGFVISWDPNEPAGIYSVSLRSVGGVKDVAKIAHKLSGGGHQPAAGGKIQADNVYNAIAKVKAVITQTL